MHKYHLPNLSNVKERYPPYTIATNQVELNILNQISNFTLTFRYFLNFLPISQQAFLQHF